MFRHSRLTALLVSLAAPPCAAAQIAKPVISAITNVASYSAGPITPGEKLTVFEAHSNDNLSNVAGTKLLDANIGYESNACGFEPAFSDYVAFE